LKKITLAWEIASNEGNNTNKSLDAARRELADKLITLRVAKKDNEVN
jgi:DNA-directed RNA polymerase subunit K/omega